MNILVDFGPLFCDLNCVGQICFSCLVSCGEADSCFHRECLPYQKVKKDFFFSLNSNFNGSDWHGQLFSKYIIVHDLFLLILLKPEKFRNDCLMLNALLY